MDLRFSGKLRGLPFVEGVPSGIGVGVGGSSEGTVTSMETNVATGRGVLVAVGSATVFDPQAIMAMVVRPTIASFQVLVRVLVGDLIIVVSPGITAWFLWRRMLHFAELSNGVFR